MEQRDRSLCIALHCATAPPMDLACVSVNGLPEPGAQWSSADGGKDWRIIWPLPESFDDTIGHELILYFEDFSGKQVVFEYALARQEHGLATLVRQIAELDQKAGKLSMLKPEGGAGPRRPTTGNLGAAVDDNAMPATGLDKLLLLQQRLESVHNLARMHGHELQQAYGTLDKLSQHVAHAEQLANDIYQKTHQLVEAGKLVQKAGTPRAIASVFIDAMLVDENVLTGTIGLTKELMGGPHRAAVFLLSTDQLTESVMQAMGEGVEIASFSLRARRELEAAGGDWLRMPKEALAWAELKIFRQAYRPYGMASVRQLPQLACLIGRWRACYGQGQYGHRVEERICAR